MLIALLLAAEVEPNPGPDVAIDCASLTPNLVTNGLSIQLLEEQVIENGHTTRTEKNIDYRNSFFSFCHVTSDGEETNPEPTLAYKQGDFSQGHVDSQ